ncbi:MAG: S24/S26 family peptidase [Bacteroidales bacterium]|nr:S24/S26 family peptidase [Bacteroidales bacterium]
MRKVVDMELYMGGISTFLAEGREVVMTPKGSSMLPFIKGDRDSVVLASPSGPLEVGDIVLAKVGQRYIMHRIFAVEGDSLTLMGDGNIYGTESCSSSDVIGVVKEIHKEGSKVVRPGKGVLWRRLRPFRRYILAIYKRVIL